MSQKKIVVVIVTLDRNKSYRSTLGIRNEVGVTIEVFIFLREGITKMETKNNFFESKILTHPHNHLYLSFTRWKTLNR